MELTEADGSPAHRRNITEPDYPIVKCAYCGTEGPWRTHSGVYECGTCWDWRKLDSAPTRYWYILSLMVGSSIDTYDLTRYFPRSLELSEDEIKSFTAVIRKMHERTKSLATEHHREEGWREQAQALYEQLETGIRPKPENKT